MRISCFSRGIPALLIAAAGFFVAATPARSASGIETLGQARFSIITPHLVRIEEAPDGNFVDAPSLFAINRATFFIGYKAERTADTLTLDTGALRVHYRQDSRSFSPQNLSVEVRQNGGWTTWMPGQKPLGNLGGPIQTLDGVSGPVALSDGLLSREGWSLVDDSRRPLLTANWVEARPRAAGTDWYFFGYGRDFKAAFEGLAAISGPVPLPRRAALGAWFSRYWAFSSSDYRSIVQKYAAHDFPLDVMVLDMDWHRDGWTGWSWNRALLPDAEALLRDLHAENLAVTLNLHPAEGVKPHEDAYLKFMRALGETPTGQTVPFDAASKPYMDALFGQIHAPLEAQGVDFWWLDWQQERQTHSIPELSNLEWLNRGYFAWTAREGKRGISFSRWGGWGDHRHPLHFSGDADAGWKSLAFQVPFTAASGNAGLFFWSHDIGGHNGGRNEESYTRWCQFGALSAALRSHSSRDQNTDRRPWLYPAWAQESMRRSFHLRDELFPYIYSSARQSSAQTIPLVRPLYFDNPNQEAAYSNGQEYRFGDALLVAPIASPGRGASRTATQAVWLPPGAWFNWFSGEKFQSPAQGTTMLASADINTLPLYARGGIPIPMQPYTPRMTGTPLSRLVVRCYPGEAGQTGTFSLYEDDGLSDRYTQGEFALTALRAKRDLGVTTLTIAPASGQFSGQLQSRAYTFELPATKPATRVLVDGKVAKARYDSARNCNIVEVPARPVSRAVRVQISAALIPEAELRLSAQRAKWSEIAGQRVRSIGEVKTPDSAEDTALLASLGVGMQPKNDAPFFYGGTDVLRFYAPPGTPPIPATLGIGESRTQTTLVAGEAISLQNLAAQLAPRDTILVPGRNFLTLSLPFANRNWTLRQPLETPFAASSGDRENLARRAKIEASSVDGGNGYALSGANDGIAGGYPGAREREWSSREQKVGATLTLRWDSPVTIGRALLFDRPNLDDGITSAKISFSDGSNVDVGELPNDGQIPAELTFAPRRANWVKIEITGVRASTQNTGLSEIALFPR